MMQIRGSGKSLGKYDDDVLWQGRSLLEIHLGGPHTLARGGFLRDSTPSTS